MEGTPNMFRTLKIFFASVLAALGTVPFAMQPAHAATTTQVVVREQPGSEALVTFAIEQLGGTVTQTLSSVDSLVVNVPSTLVPLLSLIPDVTAVTVNATLQLVPDVLSTTGKIGESLFGD